MKKIALSLAALAASVAAMPASVSACDLDGLAGFHRFNPFGAGRGFNGLAPPPTPPAEKATDKQKQGKAKEKADSTKKANAKTVQEQATPTRSWETDEGNGPVTPEDMATFT